MGDAPSLPMDLTNFLEGNAIDEWNVTPPSSTPLITDLPQPLHDEGHKCCPTGGAQPKTKPQPRRMPAMVDHRDEWSQGGRDRDGRHSHW